MKFVWSVWLLLAASFSLFAGESLVLTPTPEWVVKQTFDKENRRDRVDGSIFLLVDKQYNFTLPKPMMYTHYATKSVNSKGVEDNSQISISFDPHYEKVLFHHVDVWRDGQRIDKSREVELKRFKQESDLEKLLYNGTETYYLVLKNVQVGDIIDYSFSIEGANPVFGDKFDTWVRLGWSVPVAKVYARSLVPVDKGFTITRVGNSEFGSLTHRQVGAMEEYVFEDGRRAYDFDEKDQPSWFIPYPYINVSNYDNWQEVAQWALPLYPNSTSGRLFAKELEQLKALPSKEAQIMAAIKLSQQKIRYLGIENGIGSHAPRLPEQILEQGYGDCKDKSLLLATLLNQLGVEAYPALVSTVHREKLNEQLPGHSAFDHVIVNFFHQGIEYWVDPTVTEQGDALDSIIQSELGYALVIKPESVWLSEMNVNNSNQITSSVEYQFKHQKEGDSTMKITTLYEGHQAERMRRYLTANSMDTVMGEYEDYYSRFYQGVYAAEEFEYQDDPQSNVVTMVETYVLENPWTEGEENTVRVEVTADIINNSLYAPEAQNRKTPYYVGSPLMIEQNIVVNLPDRLKLEEEAFSVKNDTYSLDVSIKGDGEGLLQVLAPVYKKINMNYRYQRKASSVSVDELPKYIKETKQANEFMTYYFSYAKGK
ncbi:DUF3857 domain-containing protein [Vibrio vulnificus]|nr:DUF3857 domain-containing protein [Vibrio vulnificus]EHY1119539.1 DUF3857 domain-containing protein [Vibrio vulnificus]HDY7729951.1 DUF3857 domain-containing protein [Vibrio vulnificus]